MAVWLLLGLALVLRLTGLGTNPPPLATADEYHYMWAGLSLATSGTPASWSWLDAYFTTPANLGVIGPKAVEYLVQPRPPLLDDPAREHQMRIVRPAFDHPPLFSLLAGGFAALTGAEPVRAVTHLGHELTLWRIDLRRARLLPVLLFALSFLLLYDLAARHCGQRVALLALLLYATIDHIVLHSRLVVTEALSTPLLLGSLCAWDRYRLGRWGMRRYAVCTVLGTAAALLTKLVAASQAAPLVLLAVLQRRTRAAAWPVLGLVLGAAVYFAYGAAVNWHYFTLLLHANMGRFDGFGLLQQLVTHPLLMDYENANVVLFAGWLALVGLCLAGAGVRGQRLLAAGLMYVLAFGYFASVHGLYGWHLLPLYPFLVLALAMLLMQAWRQGRPIVFVAVVLLVLPASLDVLLGISPGNSQWLRNVYLVLVVAGILAGCMAGCRARAVRRALLTGLLLILLSQQVWLVYHPQPAPAPTPAADLKIPH
jgi:4-amino-4-deoxy-L-arabinose transferase-like glycosyltransferase